MSDALSLWHIDCRLRTGSASLLPKAGNAPINNPALLPKLPEALLITDGIKTLDSRNHRRDQNRSNRDSSNPHSSVETTQQQRLRPRGFLP